MSSKPAKGYLFVISLSPCGNQNIILELLAKAYNTSRVPPSPSSAVVLILPCPPLSIATQEYPSDYLHAANLIFHPQSDLTNNPTHLPPPTYLSPPNNREPRTTITSLPITRIPDTNIELVYAPRFFGRLSVIDSDFQRSIEDEAFYKLPRALIVVSTSNLDCRHRTGLGSRILMD